MIFALQNADFDLSDAILDYNVYEIRTFRPCDMNEEDREMFMELVTGKSDGYCEDYEVDEEDEDDDMYLRPWRDFDATTRGWVSIVYDCMTGSTVWISPRFRTSVAACLIADDEIRKLEN